MGNIHIHGQESKIISHDKHKDYIEYRLLNIIPEHKVLIIHMKENIDEFRLK